MISSQLRHKENNKSWTFINIYSAAQEDKKEIYCVSSLLFAIVVLPLSWLVEILISLEERKKKNKHGGTNKWSFLFNTIIDQCGLIELDLVGR